jgi:hypothetical protein
VALPGAYVPVRIVLRVVGVRKPPLHDTTVVIIFILQLNSNFMYILENGKFDYTRINHLNGEFSFENNVSSDVSVEVKMRIGLNIWHW